MSDGNDYLFEQAWQEVMQENPILVKSIVVANYIIAWSSIIAMFLKVLNIIHFTWIQVIGCIALAFLALFAIGSIMLLKLVLSKLGH